MHGLIGAQGDEHKEQRRFALRHLRDFGFGKSSMEEIINEEIRDLFDEIRKNADSNNEIQPEQVHHSQ